MGERRARQAQRRASSKVGGKNFGAESNLRCNEIILPHFLLHRWKNQGLFEALVLLHRLAHLAVFLAFTEANGIV